jgi:hypothetical protein
MGEMRNVYKIFVGKPEGKRPLGRFKHRWEDNIKINFKKQDKRMWTRFICSEQEPAVGICKHGNEPLISIKGGEFPYWHSKYYLLKKDSAPWS